MRSHLTVFGIDARDPDYVTTLVLPYWGDVGGTAENRYMMTVRRETRGKSFHLTFDATIRSGDAPESKECYSHSHMIIPIREGDQRLGSD